MLISTILILFVLGYALISLEHKIQINKTATALFLAVILWSIYIPFSDQIVLQANAPAFHQYIGDNPDLSKLPIAEQISDFVVNHSILEHLGEIAEIILFLMGAMTIVELIDRHGGFNFVNNRIKTRNRIKLLWVVVFMTFALSSVLDNLTSTIVMIMVLRKLVSSQQERWVFASMVVLAANSGGAFSPIGDVTTIMLWIKGNITSINMIKHLFLPSVFSVMIPLIILSFTMKGGDIEAGDTNIDEGYAKLGITRAEKIIIFGIGVGGLIMVPVFRYVIGLPPFMGIMGVLAVLWLYTEILYDSKTDIEESIKCRVSKVIKHIDMSTILFFFGILMAVAVLQEAGILTTFAAYLNKNLHDVYFINGLIGMLSSIVDNVPLVAGAMGMYPTIDPAALSTMPDAAYMANFVADGHFWQLLAYCAGVGGSMLIIGSAAGVVAMGLEKITFGWYLKKISGLALIGYLSGIIIYYLQTLIF